MGKAKTVGLIAAVTVLAIGGCDRMLALTKAKRTVVLDGAAGLRGGDPVRVAGVKVGRVTGMSFRHAEAVITIRVEHNTPLFQGACAIVAPKSSLGPRHMILETGTPALGPMDSRQPLPACGPAIDLPELLNQFLPLVNAGEDLDYESTVHSVRMANGFLGIVFGDEEKLEAPDIDGALSKADQRVIDAVQWLKGNKESVDEAIETGREILESRAIDVAINEADRRLARLERDLPKTFNNADAELRDLEKKVDELIAGEASRDEKIAEAMKLLADVRAKVKTFKPITKETLKTLDEVKTMTKGLTRYDEEYIRTFYQVQGYRSYFGFPSKAAKEAMDAAGVKYDKGRRFNE